MKNVTVSDIQRYVHRIALHQFENINELANIYFEDCSPAIVNKKAVVPELLSIPLTKRALVVNIVRDRTNFDISPIDEDKVTVMRDKGETLEPIYRPEISTVKEIDDEAEEVLSDPQ